MKHSAIFLTVLFLTTTGIHIANAEEATVNDNSTDQPFTTGTSSVTAQPAPPQTDVNRFRIDISLSMLNINSFYNLDADSVEALYGVTLGPLQAPLGISIGGSIRNRVSLGCRFLFGITSREYEEDAKGTYLDYKLLPYIEIAFGSRRVKPFITFSAGVGGYKSSYTSENNYESELKSVQFVAGAGAGVHIFFGERGSLDLWVFETVGVGNEAETHTFEDFDDTESDISILTATTDVLLGVGLWI
ncbi:MAG: hypothetical protein JXR76_12355 [Deltaproteobacteria bacterium]|nr:hypothetical protein [Deltaproteobacteria bacterium]